MNTENMKIREDRAQKLSAKPDTGLSGGNSRKMNLCRGLGKEVAILENERIGWIARGILWLKVIALSDCEDLAIHDTSSLLLPSFHRSEIVGIVAGFGTTFAAVPDLIKMFRRRSSKGINPTMAGIMGVFQILWIYYGLLIVSRPVIVWNLIAVVINFMTVGAYVLFARSERKQA